MSQSRSRIVHAAAVLYRHGLITAAASAMILDRYDTREALKPFELIVGASGTAHAVETLSAEQKAMDDLKPGRDPRAGGIAGGGIFSEAKVGASEGHPIEKDKRGGDVISKTEGQASAEQIAGFPAATVVDRTSLIADSRGCLWWVVPEQRRITKATAST